MSISREKKAQILEKLKNVINGSKTIIFVNFQGLNVTDASVLRRDLKQSGVSYLVSKKSLIKIALKDAGLENVPDLLGEISLAYGEDLLEPARQIYTFQKKLVDKIKILGGIFDGKVMTQVEMTEIAQIPPKEVLYAKFVNLINSPIQRLVIGLGEVAKSKTI